jgi:hypothetical protein
MSIETSWLVGAVTLASSATITVNGNDYSIAAGTYYGYDGTASRSLVDQLEAAIQNEVATASVYFRKDRYLYIDFDGNSTSLVVAESVRDELGLTAGTYGASTSITSDAIPSLLWSPGWPETTIGHPVGTSGWTDKQRVATVSPSGLTQYTTIAGTAKTVTRLRWEYVKKARVWTTDGGAGGEYRKFYDDVIEAGARWKLYSGVTEDTSSSSAVSWPSTVYGPYKTGQVQPDWWSRAIESVDTHTPIELAGHLVTEVS